MVIKIKNENDFGSYVYEFTNFDVHIGYWELREGRWAINDIEENTLSFPEVVLANPSEGKQIKLMVGSQKLDVSSPGFGIAFEGVAYIMENGHTIDKF